MLTDGYTALWLIFAAVWVLAASGVKRTVRRESIGSRLFYGIFIFLGFGLVFQPRLFRPLDLRIIPDNRIAAICGLAIAAAGIALAIWARLMLGRNWSGTVTIKEDHRLIRSGPYRLVRHPIYSGLLLATLGTAIGAGRLPCLIGVVLVFLGFRLKWKIEERFMQEQFGAQYVEYRREVKAVIPGLL